MNVSPVINLNYKSGINYRGAVRSETKIAQKSASMSKNYSLKIAGKVYTGTTFEIVKGYISDNLSGRCFDNINPEKITPNTNFYKDLHADSLDITNIAADIEDAILYRLSDEEMDKISTIQDMVNIIDSHNRN